MYVIVSVCVRECTSQAHTLKDTYQTNTEKETYHKAPIIPQPQT